MTPELFQLFALKSLGGTIGVFLGVLVGLSIRAKNGKRSGLFRDSIFATAFLASALGFAVLLLMQIVAA